MHDSKFTRLLPINAWSKYHDWPTECALRHYVSRGRSNGFDAVIRRIGRRVLIDEGAFFLWASSAGAVGSTSTPQPFRPSGRLPASS